MFFPLTSKLINTDYISSRVLDLRHSPVQGESSDLGNYGFGSLDWELAHHFLQQIGGLLLQNLVVEGVELRLTIVG